MESELQDPGWPGDSVGGGICCLSAVPSPPAAPVSGPRTHLGASCISPGQTSLAHPEAGLGSLHTSLALCGNLAGLPGEAEACAGSASQKGCGVPSLPSPQHMHSTLTSLWVRVECGHENQQHVPSAEIAQVFPLAVRLWMHSSFRTSVSPSIKRKARLKTPRLEERDRVTELSAWNPPKPTAVCSRVSVNMAKSNFLFLREGRFKGLQGHLIFDASTKKKLKRTKSQNHVDSIFSKIEIS